MSKVIVTIPVIGFLSMAAQSREGIMIIGLAILFLVILFILSEVWKRDEEEDEEEEEEGSRSKIQFAPLAVFCTFFVAELGDKTQLTAITFGANEGMSAAFVVWIGCSLGLFAADILGMLIGYLLKSKAPDGLLNTLAVAIFSVFGVYTLYQGLKLIRASVYAIPVFPILIVVTVIFAGLCGWLFYRKSDTKIEDSNENVDKKDTDENGKSDPSDATDNKKDDNSGNKDADTGNYIDSNCSSNCSSDCSDRNGFIYPEEKETEVEL